MVQEQCLLSLNTCEKCRLFLCQTYRIRVSILTRFLEVFLSFTVFIHIKFTSCLSDVLYIYFFNPGISKILHTAFSCHVSSFDFQPLFSSYYVDTFGKFRSVLQISYSVDLCNCFCFWQEYYLYEDESFSEHCSCQVILLVVRLSLNT